MSIQFVRIKVIPDTDTSMEYINGQGLLLKYLVPNILLINYVLEHRLTWDIT